MKYYDLHTHTQFSDGAAALSLLKETADKKGYGLGVSDHLFCGGMDTLLQIGEYLDALEQYADILKGGEANMGEDYSMPDAIMNRFDYIIASVHAVPDLKGGRVMLPEYFGERAGDPGVKWIRDIDENRCEEYLEAMLPMVRHTMETMRVDIYGHCSVLPFCEILEGTSFLKDWENEIISLCLKYNAAIEISGLWKEPNADMIKRAKEQGVKFTLGSDCHILPDLCNLDYAIQVCEKAGLTEKHMYLPKRG